LCFENKNEDKSLTYIIVVMDGIKYLEDQITNKKYVQIDLEKYGALWPDFLDVIIAHSRKNDKKTPFADVKRQVLENDL
jgi:hypothetical protein